MNSAQPSTCHEQLRQATKRPHHVLDHHPVLTPLLLPGVSRLEYGNALAALHGVYAQAEAWIQHALEHLGCNFDYATRRKLPALEADLAALGRVPFSSSLVLNRPPSMGALIGALYTVEGSTLGGQFIARSLRQHLGQETPLGFFSVYGDLTQQRWQAFLAFAEANCPQSDVETATDMAVSMFEAIALQLDEFHRHSAA